jgi:hypothetical protein
MPFALTESLNPAPVETNGELHYRVMITRPAVILLLVVSLRMVLYTPPTFEYSTSKFACR